MRPFLDDLKRKIPHSIIKGGRLTAPRPCVKGAPVTKEGSLCTICGAIRNLGGGGGPWECATPRGCNSGGWRSPGGGLGVWESGKTHRPWAQSPFPQ